MSAPGHPVDPLQRRARRRLLLLFVAVAGALALAVAGVFVYVKRLSPTARVQRYQQEAQLLLRQGKVDEAIDRLEAARALAPDDVGLAVRLARTYAAKGAVAEAVAVLSAAAARHPEQNEPALGLAELHLERGQPREAHAVLAPIAERLAAIAGADERAAALLLWGRATLAAVSPEAARPILAQAAQAGPAPALRGAIGDAQAAAGDLAGAEASLRHAVERDPKQARAALALAGLLEAGGRRAEAIAVLEATGAVEPPLLVGIAPQLCRLLLAEGRSADAAALVDRVGADPTGAAAAADMRATIAEREGDLDAARAHLEQLAQRAPGAARPHLRLGELHLRRGDPERARAAFERALELEPDARDAELLIAELNVREGKLEAAAERAERLVSDGRFRDRAVSLLIAVHTRGAEPAEAAARLRAVPEVAAHPRAQLALALLDAAASGAEVPIDEVVRLLEASPDLPGGFATLAAAATDSVGALEALDALARLAGKDPRLAGARLTLAREYERVGRRDLAARELDAALAARPDLHEARLARAGLALAAGDAARAEAELSALRGSLPRNRQVLLLLADLRLRRGDAAGAIELLVAARDLEPGDAVGLARLGRALAVAGRWDDAARAFEAARRLRPRLGLAYDDGGALLAQGKHAEAAAALERAFDAAGEARFLGAAAAARALAGDPAAALAPLRAYAGRTRDGAAVLAEAMLLGLAGDPRGAAEAAGRAGVPDPVAQAASAVGAGDEGVAARARVALELFGFRALGWEPETLARVRRVAQSRVNDPLLTWWAAASLERLAASAPGDLRLEVVRRLAEACPDDAQIGLALADAEAAAGGPERALAVLRHLEARFSSDPRVALGIGMALEALGDRDAAREAYGRAATAANPSPIALNNYAYHLADQATERPLAIEYATRALRAAPASGPAAGGIADTLGWLLFLDGRVDEATPILEQAVARAPASPTIRYHLGAALAARGAVRRAIAHLEMALLGAEGGAFAEREAAERLLAEVKAERAAAAALGAGAPALAPGGRAKVPASAGAMAFRLAPPADGAQGGEVSLAIAASAGAAVEATLLRDGRSVKRLHVDAGARLAIRRLALPAGGLGLVVRSAAGDAEVEVGAAPAAAPGGGAAWEVEPDLPATDRERTAVAAGIHEGAFDGPADEDIVAIEPGAGVDVAIRIGPRGAARAQLLERPARGGLALKRELRIEAGSEAVLTGLQAGEAGAALLLRLSPASALAAPAAGRVGEAADHRVELRVSAPASPASLPDREPNDRVADAAKLAVPAKVESTAGVFDRADWFAIDAPAATVVALRLSRAAPAEPYGLELWERTGGDARLVRRYVGAREPIVVERWRTPATGALLVAVGPVGGASSTLAYTLEVEGAGAGAGVETEPNDAWASAEALAIGGSLGGRLDGTDRDWVRVEGGAASRTVAIRLDGERPDLDALLLVVADPGRRPERVAVHRTRGGRIDVPALRLPSGPVAIVLSGLRPEAHRYALAIGEAKVSPEVEVEPNDEAVHALKLAPATPVSGVISGQDDVDVYRVEALHDVTVEATGKASVAVRVVGEDREDRVVAPGAPLRVQVLGRGLVEVRPSWPAAPSAREAGAALPATYRIAVLGR